VFVDGPGWACFVEGGTCLEFECLVREMLVIDLEGNSTNKLMDFWLFNLI
jgi:hypothetical protein